MEETRLIPLPTGLLGEIQSYLRPDEEIGDFIRRAVHQCIAFEDMQPQQELEWELIGVLRPELWLWAKDPRETAHFYQRLGFKALRVSVGLDYTLISRGIVLSISQGYSERRTEDSPTDIIFVSSVDYKLLEEPLRRLGLAVQAEPVDLDPGCLTLTDPDGRKISIYSEKPDLTELMTNGYW